MSLNAICIGCGCDEDHACPFGDLHVADPCWWYRFSAETKTGVCSSCTDLLAAWDKGERRPLFEVIALRYYRQAMTIYHDPQDAIAWMRIPHQLLAGRAPMDVIRAGGLDAVRQLVDQMRSGAFA
jgi:hypothetical protein